MAKRIPVQTWFLYPIEEDQATSLSTFGYFSGTIVEYYPFFRLVQYGVDDFVLYFGNDAELQTDEGTLEIWPADKPLFRLEDKEEVVQALFIIGATDYNYLWQSVPR